MISVYWVVVLILSFIIAYMIHYLYSNVKDVVAPSLIIERHFDDLKNESRLSQSEDGDFKSRFLDDYDPIDCIGLGGFGIVFEARKKLDGESFAIKRIPLINSNKSRDRALREVNALAKLQKHPNIIGYFDAWLECPPAGWQEKYDQRWPNHKNFPSTGSTTESSSNNSSSVSSVNDDLEGDEDDEDSFSVLGDPSSEGVANIDRPRNTKNVQILTSDSSKGEKSNDVSITFERTKKRPKEYSEPRKSQLNLDLKESKDSDESNEKMYLYIKMELCQRSSLREWLDKNTRRNPSDVFDIFTQLVDAIGYVHSHGMIHCDLKPANIFFALEGNTIKVGDFGLVTAMAKGTSSNNNEINEFKREYPAHFGTSTYKSPEQLNEENYDNKADIYSLGIIFFELLVSFSTEMEMNDALTNLRNLVFPRKFIKKYPAEHDLISKMLDENPENRPTTSNIKAHPLFSIRKGTKSIFKGLVDCTVGWKNSNSTLNSPSSADSSITNSSGSDS